MKRAGPSTNSTWSILKIARFVGPSVDYVLIKKMESVTGSTSSTQNEALFAMTEGLGLTFLKRQYLENFKA